MSSCLDTVLDTLLSWRKMASQLEEILMKLSLLPDAIGLVGDQLAKAKTEILAKQDALLAKIAELEDMLANLDVEVPQEVLDVLENVKVQAQALDDIVPDIEPPVEPPVS